MYIVSVIPLSKKNNKEVLSYISSEAFEPGSRVIVPVRNKTLPSLVLSVTKASDMKAELKNLAFTLKKIPPQKSVKQLFRPEIIALSKILSEYYAKTEGAILSALSPEIYREKNIKEIPDDFKKPGKANFLAIQGDDTERIEAIKSIIRESFAKKQSIFIIPSTKGRQEFLAKEVQKGIEQYVFVFDGTSEKKIENFIEKQKKHPVAVFGSLEVFALLPGNLGAIIIEEESSRFHKSEKSPYVDKRFASRALAKILGLRLFFADTMLSIETLHELQNGTVTEYGRVTKKIPRQIKTLGIDMRTSGNTREEKKDFTVLSPELIEMISYSSQKGKKLFVFCARSGYASQTLCLDCGEIVKCLKCKAPVVLHRNKRDEELNSFICHHCASKRSALETCRRCGGWRLQSFGIGIERIVEEIKKITKTDVLVYDQDSVRSLSSGKKIIKEFLDESPILVGTESALNMLPPESVDYSAIASFDYLFSLPDFRLGERIIHLIIKAKSIARECLLLQGRNIENTIVEYGLSGEISKFAEKDLREREMLGYPPFKTLIKITLRGERQKIDSELSHIAPLFAEWKPIIFPAFIKTGTGEAVSHMLLRLPSADWPNKKLGVLLMSLPPFVSVKVDPESLL